MTLENVGKFFSDNWRDLVSVAGLVFTVWTLFRANTAARAAKEAVTELKKKLSTFDTALALSSIIDNIKQIRKLQREDAWKKVPSIYTTVRMSLAEIHSNNLALSECDREQIQNAATELAQIEERIETELRSNREPDDMAQINQIISEYEAAFTTIRSKLRQ